MPLPRLEELTLGRNHQIDNREVHPALGEVNVLKMNDGLQITATILAPPQARAEGWQTGVAIDCSYSMKRNFGGKNSYLTREMTDAELKSYQARNLVSVTSKDGKQLLNLYAGAYEQMLKDGLLTEIDEPNEVQDVCRKVIPMLAGELDADGGTTVIYWALGTDGSRIQVMGNLTKDDAAAAEYTGPASEEDWGYGTKLMPSINYFMKTFSDAPMGFYVFITDGRLDDFEEVKQFTIQLSKDMAAKKVNPVKMVLIGVGPEIDEKQLEDLDDLPDTCDLPVDVWDFKVAKEMRSLLDIFSELVDENKCVAPRADVQDDSGKLIRSYTDGLPMLLKFTLPATAKGFRIVMPNGKTLEQKILA